MQFWHEAVVTFQNLFQYNILLKFLLSGRANCWACWACRVPSRRRIT